VTAGTDGGRLHRLLQRRAPDGAAAAQHLPDPARPPQNRGRWEDAALTNVDITEVVKRQIGSRTLPWQK